MQRAHLVGLAFLIGLVLVCDLAVVGLHYLDDHTTLIRGRAAGGQPPTTEVKVVPGEGQAFVTGTIERLSADGAQIPALRTPFTATAVERGEGRITIEQALVGGRRVTISWDGGTPLPFRGGEGLDLGATHVEVDEKGPVISLDGAPRRFLPGTYSLGATVAVGTGGLAAPRDGVQFTADAQTVLATQGYVVVRLDPQKIDLLGPGKVVASGQMKVQYPDRTVNASSISFGDGPYRVTVDPRGDRGLAVDAILQGEVAVR